MKLPAFLERLTKNHLIVGVVAAASEAAATGLLHGTAEHVVQAILAVAAALGMAVVPNKPAAKPVAPPAA